MPRERDVFCRECGVLLSLVERGASVSAGQGGRLVQETPRRLCGRCRDAGRKRRTLRQEKPREARPA